MHPSFREFISPIIRPALYVGPLDALCEAVEDYLGSDDYAVIEPGASTSLTQLIGTHPDAQVVVITAPDVEPGKDPLSLMSPELIAEIQRLPLCRNPKVVIQTAQMNDLYESLVTYRYGKADIQETVLGAKVDFDTYLGRRQAVILAEAESPSWAQGRPAYSPDEAVPMIRRMVDRETSVQLVGDRGVGKSTIVRAALGDKYNVVTQDLSTVDPIFHVIGVPYEELDEKTQQKFLKFLRTKHWDEADVLFLDEFNRAKPQVRNAIMNLVLEKKIGEYHLPKLKAVVTAINPPHYEDVQAIDPAHNDRFFFRILIVPNPTIKSLMDYGVKSKKTAEALIKWWNKLDEEQKTFINPRRLTEIGKHWDMDTEENIPNEEKWHHLIGFTLSTHFESEPSDVSLPLLYQLLIGKDLIDLDELAANPKKVKKFDPGKVISVLQDIRSFQTMIKKSYGLIIKELPAEHQIALCKANFLKQLIASLPELEHLENEKDENAIAFLDILDNFFLVEENPDGSKTVPKNGNGKLPAELASNRYLRARIQKLIGKYK